MSDVCTAEDLCKLFSQHPMYISNGALNVQLLQEATSTVWVLQEEKSMASPTLAAWRQP